MAPVSPGKHFGGAMPTSSHKKKICNVLPATQLSQLELNKTYLKTALGIVKSPEICEKLMRECATVRWVVVAMCPCCALIIIKRACATKSTLLGPKGGSFATPPLTP